MHALRESGKDRAPAQPPATLRGQPEQDQANLLAKKPESTRSTRAAVAAAVISEVPNECMYQKRQLNSESQRCSRWNVSSESLFMRPLQEADGGSGGGEPALDADKSVSRGSNVEELERSQMATGRRCSTERLLHDPKERSPAAHAARHC